MDPDIVRTEDIPQWAQDIVAWIHDLPPQPPIQKWIKIRANQARTNDFPDITTEEQAEEHFRRLGVPIVDGVTVID